MGGTWAASVLSRESGAPTAGIGAGFTAGIPLAGANETAFANRSLLYGSSTTFRVGPAKVIGLPAGIRFQCRLLSEDPATRNSPILTANNAGLLSSRLSLCGRNHGPVP